MKPFRHSLLRRRFALAALIGALATATVAVPAWKFEASAAIKQGYDSNVYLQDDFAGAASAPARKGSGITAVSVALGTERQWPSPLTLTAGYAADRSWFWSAPGEDNTTHRLSLGLAARASATIWNAQASLLRPDGSSDGPIYAGAGGSPALGSVAVRDRRDALVTNASFKLMHTVGRWQLRPAANFHYQDFDTPHRRLSGCANYIDRSELFVGADLARQLAANTFVIAGYRIGAQRQYKLYGIDRPYDRRIDRFLAGFEGTLHPGLQLTALVGPEIRHYAAGTAADFDRAERPWWVDASLTFKPSPQRSVALCFRRQTLPSSSSLGIYASGTWELTWRERLSDHCSVAAGLKLARGDWMAPALREDRIVTPFACYTRSLGPRRQLELTWTFDDAISRVPATPGRASHRDVASVSYRDAL